jgi:VCBS repeat-containing protein
LNFVGKFDAKLPVEGAGAHSSANAHVDSFSHHASHVPSDAIIVPDTQLLFHGDFKRSGVDLVLSKDDHELVLHDYFKGEKRAALASPDGAQLTGDIVNALTGHVEMAQAGGAPAAAAVIGHVTKLTGTATAVRNGVSIILNNGDNVEKGDVVQSGSDSTLGITFIDGTVFGLLSNARMVLNEMVYDPNGSNNASLLSLVAGTISFVAGETAKHGDMKIDTPVATMGIRGTAVLVEIDFSIPGTGGAPDAKFQVLVEPDGHTGSYILFDKNTLTPIATVDQAGQQINIHQGVVSITNTPLPPEIQKLITDVFAQKFTDNSNPKSNTQFTDSINPLLQEAPIKLADGTTATPVVLTVNSLDATLHSSSTPPPTGLQHIPGGPNLAILDPGGHVASGFGITELAGKTGDAAPDKVIVQINWADINPGDVPTVTVTADTHAVTYHDAHGNNIALNALQQQDIAKVDVNFTPVPGAGNNNNGSATWTYSIPDNAFDFLAAGETLTLTYVVVVQNNFALNNETTTQNFTITIAGTNDVPVITTSAPALAFTGDHEVVAGFLSATDPATGKPAPTQGTLDFNDPDLTDTHSVSVALKTPAWSGGAVPPGPLAAFEAALTAKIGTDSTGSGHGAIDWQLAPLPDFLADFLPAGETLTLTYTITVTDSRGAPATQDVTVTITHTTPPDVAWIHPTDGLWSDGANWETGNVPTKNDDVVIPDEQVIGGTGHYAVTVAAVGDTTAFEAKSVTLDAANTTGAQLIIDKDITLTISGTLTLLADSSLQNSGLITLGQGGDFQDQSTVSNASTGTIEIAGGTLDVLVDIANSGRITIDPDATLALNGVITGGIVTDNGSIHVIGDSAINGAAVNGGQVTIDFGKTLKLNGTTVTGTAIADNGTLEVDLGQTLKLSGVALTGGAISDFGALEIIDDSSINSDKLVNNQLIIDSGKTLTLANTAVGGGVLLQTESGLVLTGTISNLGTIHIADDSSITSDVLNNNQLTVDIGKTLTINGTTIIGGTVTDSGMIHVAGDSAVDGAMVNGGHVTVDATTTLTLDNVTATATVFTDTAIGAALSVDSESTLTLQGGADVHGGSLFNAGTVHIETLAGATFDGVDVVNAGGVVQVDIAVAPSLVTLTFLDSSTVTGGTLAIGNSGKVEIASAATANWDGVTVDNGVGINPDGHIQADGTLDVSGTTISGGTLGISGTLQSTGINAIDGADIINSGTFEVSGGTMTIDAASTVISTGTFEVNGANLIVDGMFFGTATILGASLLELGAANSTADTTFAAAATGTLQLDHAKTFGGTVSGLDDNTLDLRDIASGDNPTASYAGNASGGTLSIFVGGVDVADINLSGDYLGAHWVLADDKSSAHGTAITEVPGAIAGLDSNGNASEGGAIAASITDGGQSVTGATYDWQIFDNTKGWVDGSGTGVTSANYTPGEQDEGRALRVSLSFTDANGNTEHTTASAGTVNGTADIPVVSTPDAITTTEDVPHPLTGLQVSTADGGADDNDTFSATLYVEHGTLVLGGELAATISGGDGHDLGDAVVITGSLADVNAALKAVTYTPAGEYEGTDTVHFTATSTEDFGSSTSAPAPETTATITVNGVAEMPVVSTPDAKTTTENHPAIALTGLIVTPADASANDTADTFNVTLSVNDGSLALADHSGLSGTFSGASITFSGSLAAVNAALTGVSYTPTSEFEGQDTLTFTASTTEEASAGGGTSATAPHTATITVNGVAEAGTASAPATLTLTENATNVAITGVSVGPVAEDGDDTVSAVLAVGHGTLHMGSLAGVTVTNNGTGSVTVAGSAALVNTVLAGLTYTPTTEFNGSDSLHVTVTSNDGSNTSATQGTASTAITVNDGPNDLVATLDSQTAKQGVTINVTGVKDGGITVTTGLSYEWQDSTNNGQSWQTVGTDSSYTPGESDEGKLMQLVVTYADAGGHESSTYNLGMPNDLVATVDSTIAQQGLAIHVTGAKDGGTALSTGLSYAWQDSSDNGHTWTTVGTNSSYTPVAADAGKLLQVTVTYMDPGEKESVTDSLGTVAPAKEAAGATLEIASAAISGAATLKIDAGGTLQLDHADAHNVTFAGPSGELILLDPAHFTGQIAGITGSGEVLDLRGFAAATTTASTGAGSYNHTTNITTLTVTDSSDHRTETFKLTGDLSGSAWTVSNDHNGGANIVDPPASGGPAVAGVVAHDPGPAPSTIVASAPNQTLTGSGASDNFVFNFASVGHDTVTNFHPETDTLQFSSPVFANAQAALSAIQDDGHGNTVVALDAHDAITLSGVLKAQLHVTDFHFV